MTDPAAAPPTAANPGPPREDAAGRVGAGLLALVCLGVLITAMALRPNAAGHGTHTALGLPPCGWALTTGKPCPTCGMTTAFAHAAKGHLGRAFVTQPFGALLAILAATVVWIAGYVAATGSMIGRTLAGLIRARVMWAGGALLLLAWAYKYATWRTG